MAAWKCHRGSSQLNRCGGALVPAASGLKRHLSLRELAAAGATGVAWRVERVVVTVPGRELLAHRHRMSVHPEYTFQGSDTMSRAERFLS